MLPVHLRKCQPCMSLSFFYPHSARQNYNSVVCHFVTHFKAPCRMYNDSGNVLSVVDQGGGSRGEVIKTLFRAQVNLPIYEIGAPGVGLGSRAVLMWYLITFESSHIHANQGLAD